MNATAFSNPSPLRRATPADVADVMPWMGEGFMGGVQATALESLKEAAQAGEANARAAMDGCSYAKTRFTALQTPVWAGLSAESRLSDVVVFANDPARGRGPHVRCVGRHCRVGVAGAHASIVAYRRSRISDVPRAACIRRRASPSERP